MDGIKLLQFSEEGYRLVFQTDGKRGFRLVIERIGPIDVVREILSERGESLYRLSVELIGEQLVRFRKSAFRRRQFELGVGCRNSTGD